MLVLGVADGPGPKVCLWGLFNSTEDTDILSEHFLSYFHPNFRNNPIFMLDNPLPTACNIKTFLEKHEILSLDWPAQSPLLSPIENFWHCYAIIKLQTLKTFRQKYTKSWWSYIVVLQQTNTRNTQNIAGRQIAKGLCYEILTSLF